MKAEKLKSITEKQTIELNNKAVIKSNEKSAIKRPYVEDKKLIRNKEDFFLLAKNLPTMAKLFKSVNDTSKIIKKDTPLNTNKNIDENTFKELNKLIKDLNIDEYGYFEIKPEMLLKDHGVPYKYALVLSQRMDNLAFESAPSMECQIEVMRIYKGTGQGANEIAKFLSQKGYGASPNHSMGGQLDYSMAAEWANIGVVGRHSMAITKTSGPCNRISVVYTDIENLGDYIKNDKKEMLWINDFCDKCGNCIRKCPTKAIYEEPTILDGYYPTKVNYEKCSAGFSSYGCGVCIKACPFTNKSYDKIKEAFNKQKL